MATDTPPGASAGISLGGCSREITGDLRDIALEATYELEALLQALVQHLPLPSGQLEIYAIRGMALRAAQLNGVVMSVLGDATSDVVGLRQDVFGQITALQRTEQPAPEVSHG